MSLILGTVLILVGTGLIFAARGAGLIFITRPDKEGVAHTFVHRGTMELLYLTFCLGLLAVGVALLLGGSPLDL